MTKSFHPLLALIASASSNELAKYVEFLKEENKILRARIPGQVHTRPDERSRLVKLGKALGQAIEELITLVAPSTFYRWCREEKFGKKAKNPKGGQRKPRELRKLVIEIATTTSNSDYSSSITQSSLSQAEPSCHQPPRVPLNRFSGGASSATTG